MHRNITVGLTMLMIGTGGLVACKKEAPQKPEAPQALPGLGASPAPMSQHKTGESLFKQHCAVCHPDGGNVVKPEYTLHHSALKAHNIKRPEDIVRIMRNPGQGMNRFDEAAIPDRDAMEIAEYVLNTFK